MLVFQHVCISTLLLYFNICPQLLQSKVAFSTEMEIVLINEDQFQGPGPAGFSSVTTKLLQSEYRNPSIIFGLLYLKTLYFDHGWLEI